MKKLFLSCALLLLTAGLFCLTPQARAEVTLDAAHFPNAAFRNFISGKFDKDQDGVLSNSELSSAKTIEINSNMGIASMQGIEYLHALQRLVCSYNPLTSLDVSQNTALKTLSYQGPIGEEGPFLQALDVSGSTSLETLQVHRTRLSALDVSGNPELRDLRVGLSPLITALDLSGNAKLTYLSCNDCSLAALGLSHNPLLQNLSCSGNELPSLDVTHNPELKALVCYGNEISQLDLSGCPQLTAIVEENEPVTSSSGYIYYGGLYTLAFDAGVELIGIGSEDTGLAVDAENFPNAVFRNWVSTHCDLDGDGSLSPEEITAVTAIDVSGLGLSGGHCLDGIGFFNRLEELDCSDNSISQLYTEDNAQLRVLNCSYNGSISLNLTQNTRLEELACAGASGMGTLDLTNCPRLTVVNAEGSDFLHLSLSGHDSLRSLNLADCASLTALDISGCPILTNLIETVTPSLSGSNIRYEKSNSAGNRLLIYPEGVPLTPAPGGGDTPDDPDDPADLATVELPYWLTTIEEEAFRGTAVECVILPVGVREIGAYAFADCPSLREVRIPDFPVIDPTAFDGHRSDLTIVTEDDVLIEWAAENGIQTRAPEE